MTEKSGASADADRAGGLKPRAVFHRLGLSALIPCALIGCAPRETAETYGLNPDAPHARYSLDGKERCFEHNKLAPCSPYWDYQKERYLVPYKAANADCSHRTSEPKAGECREGWSTNFDRVLWSSGTCDNGHCEMVTSRPQKDGRMVEVVTFSEAVCKRDRRAACQWDWDARYRDSGSHSKSRDTK